LGVVEHLKRIQRISGEIPQWMLANTNQKISQLAVKRALRNI